MGYSKHLINVHFYLKLLKNIIHLQTNNYARTTNFILGVMWYFHAFF